MGIILEVKDLVVRFYTQEGTVYAVNGVSYELEEGETLGIVGESGSGKSVSSLAVMGLIPSPPGKVEAGVVNFEGRDLLQLKAGSNAADPWQGNRHDLPGSDDLAESGFDHRHTDHRVA